MNEEQVQAENPRDDVPPQQSSSPEKKGSAFFAWVVLIVILLLIAVYFYYSFVSQRADTDESLQRIQIESLEPSEEVVQAYTYEDLLDTEFTEETGRYFVSKASQKALYYDAANFCDVSCGLAWKPFSGSLEVNDEVLTSEYNEDTGNFEYKAFGRQVYTYMGDKYSSHTRGLESDNGFVLATP